MYRNRSNKPAPMPLQLWRQPPANAVHVRQLWEGKAWPRSLWFWPLQQCTEVRGGGPCLGDVGCQTGAPGSSICHISSTSSSCRSPSRAVRTSAYCRWMNTPMTAARITMHATQTKTSCLPPWSYAAIAATYRNASPHNVVHAKASNLPTRPPNDRLWSMGHQAPAGSGKQACGLEAVVPGATDIGFRRCCAAWNRSTACIARRLFCKCASHLPCHRRAQCTRAGSSSVCWLQAHCNWVCNGRVDPPATICAGSSQKARPVAIFRGRRQARFQTWAPGRGGRGEAQYGRGKATWRRLRGGLPTVHPLAVHE